MRVHRKKLWVILLLFTLTLTAIDWPAKFVKAEVNLEDYGTTSNMVTAKCTMAEGSSPSDGYYEYELELNNQSGGQIQDWIAVAQVGSSITGNKTAEWASWSNVSCQQIGATLYIYPSISAPIASGGKRNYSKIGFSTNANAGAISSVTVYYSTASGAFSEAIETIHDSAPAISGDGTGYGNTYLAGYHCSYTLTGKTKDMAVWDTPVGKHGALHVSGTQLMDEHNKPVTLRGTSTHGLQWDGMSDFVNKEAFSNLRDEWGVNMVRLACYVSQGGYTQGSQSKLDDLIQKGVDYASELGMYALVDWHLHENNGAAANPVNYQAEAIAFFDKYSKMYKDKKNVLYEICNEPTSTPWETIRGYAQAVEAAIRANDPDAIIIVGTNTWSQDVDAINRTNRLEDENTMYTFHFYAGTHGEGLRTRVANALDAGTPVFVTEFGICDASGNGGFNVAEADKWIDFFEKRGVSYCCWSLTNKDESASYLSPLSSKKSGWTNADLGGTGAWLINTYRGLADKENGTDTKASPTPAPAIPTKAPAIPTKAPVTPTKAPAIPTKSPDSEYTIVWTPDTPIEIIAPEQTATAAYSIYATAKMLWKLNTSIKVISYRFDNSKIATINKKGEVLGKKAGTTRIYALLADGSEICAQVVVKKPSVKLKKKKLTIRRYRKAKVKIKKKLKTDKVVSFKTSKKRVAKVSKKGVIKALRRGKTTISIKMKSGTVVKCKVTVR